MDLAEVKNFHAEFKKDTKLYCFLLAKHLVLSNDIITLGENIRIVYLYKNGYYQEGIHELRKQIQDLIFEFATKKNVSEIIEHVMVQTYQGALSDIKDNTNYINFKNGIYDIQNKKLLEHSPDYKFFNQIPVIFDTTKQCLNILSFLKSIIDEWYIPIIQEWAGFMLFRSYFIKKALIITGPPDTGKTTFLNLLNKFIGDENKSGVTLKNLTSDKFAGQSLLHKHANICDELSSFDIKDTNPFKKATGGSSIRAEKKFQDATDFFNYAKLVFACNKIPVVLDIDDEAYFERWIILVFDKIIIKKDKFLMDKITTEDELSGFLNFALIGLHRLIDKQEFSLKIDREQVKQIMIRNSSSIAAFAYDVLENPDDPYCTITKQEMYAEYCKYCRQYKLKIETLELLGRDLKQYATYISAESNGKQRIWANVKLKNTDNNLFDNTTIEHLSTTELDQLALDGDNNLENVF